MFGEIGMDLWLLVFSLTKVLHKVAKYGQSLRRPINFSSDNAFALNNFFFEETKAKKTGEPFMNTKVFPKSIYLVFLAKTFFKNGVLWSFASF